MGFTYKSSEDGQVIETPQARPDLDILATWTRTGWADVSSISAGPEETILGGPFPTGPNVSPRQNSNNSGPNTVGEDATPDEVFVQDNPAKVFDAGQAAADYEAEHDIPNDGPRPNGGPSEEDYQAAVERTEIGDTTREGQPVEAFGSTIQVRADIASELATEREEQTEDTARPGENATTERWAAYAKREEIDLDGATARKDIILAVKRAQQPALSASTEDWQEYVSDVLGIDPADTTDLNRDQLAQKYGA